MKTIHIAGASGFWGDSFMAAPSLLADPRLNYLVFDYLAEITMSILAKAKTKNPELGYALDFIDPTLKLALPICAERGIKVISNAGGVNPIACGKAIETLVASLGLKLRVAVVTGDNLIERQDELAKAGIKEMFSGATWPSGVMSINAYLGAFPIADALAKGADIVVTGRCVDSAVTLGPCIHEFGWKPTDYDRLAGGSLAGHIIECGAQATGGLFTDWKLGGDWANIGYPIVEVDTNGDFVVSKPEKTGGIVCRGGIAEQLVYEIGDPSRYILPDVVCDFSQVEITDIGPDRVQVRNAKGLPPTDSYKVSATYFDGFRITASLCIRGFEAEEKVRKTFEAVLKRVRGMLKRRGAPDFTETNIEILGVESGYGPHAKITGVREVIGRLSAKHPVQEALAVLLRELTSSATSMAPGTTGDGVNRPKPSPVVRLFSLLIPKKDVPVSVSMGDETWPVKIELGKPLAPASPSLEKAGAVTKQGDVEVPLLQIAHGRSGDKGNDANIGIIARKPEFLPYIREQITPGVVKDYFSYLCEGPVERFDLPGIGAVNFLLHEALGGGGVASLRQDPQGKALAQILLAMPVRIPGDLLK